MIKFFFKDKQCQWKLSSDLKELNYNDIDHGDTESLRSGTVSIDLIKDIRKERSHVSVKHFSML
jgi:hypothetical protein